MNGKLARSLRKTAKQQTIGMPLRVTRVHYRRMKKFYNYLKSL